MHAHFFPERVFASLWKWFEARWWGISYKGTPDELAEKLRSFGVKRFVTYNYAHKPGMAARLNEWTASFCEEHPEAIPFATVHPDDTGNAAMVDDLFDRGFAGVKIQPLVSDFYPCDPRMDEVYGRIVERGRILTAHAGTGPAANQYVGADNFEPVMDRFPEMKVIVAHMGAFEYDRFFDIARRCPNVFLDTSVNFIDQDVMRRLIEERRFPPLEIPSDIPAEVLLELQDRLLFGSDFPNIPYTYTDCIESITSLGLGDEFEEAVFYGNAGRLLATL